MIPKRWMEHQHLGNSPKNNTQNKVGQIPTHPPSLICIGPFTSNNMSEKTKQTHLQGTLSPIP